MNSTPLHTAYVALGSNLGDRAEHLKAALAELPRRGVEVVRVSSFFETEPVEPPPGEEHLNYLNAAAEVRTALEPRRLLDVLHYIEGRQGRVRTGRRHEARTLDLDLLLYDDRVEDEEGLCLPHPRMSRRRFVLAPLAEIAPEAWHPVAKKTVRELLESLADRA
ncbi:MAG: 2-amino-4-hydroxy-6-hydroxymethyldihydropteridine diphosphokinase [Planctomycetota bacterium]|nr:2-amino-4-hydroxy-6-hydroxymethyldihydropteridine diphosphokinase [Planctomycetota bacterium]